MGELRKDYLLNRWVIIATERGKRPHQFKKENVSINNNSSSKDFFAPENESDTPPEIYRLGENPWQTRVFANKFAAVHTKGNPNIETHNEFYTFASAYGHHEIVVETPDTRQLWDLSQKELKKVLLTYINRYENLKKKDNIKYVQIFKNHKKEAGTSIVHSHSQIIAYNIIPSIVQEEMDACKDLDKYGEIIEKEKDSERKCFENDSWIAFTPYASRFPFEILLFPKEFKQTLEECNLDDLAKILSKTLIKLKELQAPFNYVLHYGTKDNKLRFHIEILPRLATWAGFEFNGTIINTMSPENAAKFYRGEE